MTGRQILCTNRMFLIFLLPTLASLFVMFPFPKPKRKCPDTLRACPLVMSVLPQTSFQTHCQWSSVRPDTWWHHTLEFLGLSHFTAYSYPDTLSYKKKALSFCLQHIVDKPSLFPTLDEPKGQNYIIKSKHLSRGRQDRTVGSDWGLIMAHQISASWIQTAC